MTPSDSTPPILGARFAIALGVALLAGFSAMAVLTVRDSAARPSLEVLEVPPTGVGEPPGIPRPEDDRTLLLLTHDGGKPLYMDGVDDEDDSIMFHAGFDDSGKVRLYRRFKKGRLGKPLYAKIGPKEYVKLSSRPKAPKAPKPAETKETKPD